MKPLQQIAPGMLLSLALWTVTGLADETRQPGGTPAPESYVDTQRLDLLFRELREADSESQARRVEHMIWQAWTHPLDEELAQRMEAVREAQRLQATGLAIRLLDRIIERWNGYAEAYNQRAFMYFQAGEYRKSLEDIAETLAREPRHFGSLAGRGLIRLQQGERELAKRNISAAMDIHPYLRERVLFPELTAK